MNHFSILAHYKKKKKRQRQLITTYDKEVVEKRREKAKRDIYEKYYTFYTNAEEANLARMIATSIDADEQACIIYEEHVAAHPTPEDPLTGDDLETIFEGEIIPGYVSLKRLVRQLVTDCRHILRFRSVLCRDTLVPVICVQYYLVWQNPHATG